MYGHCNPRGKKEETLEIPRVLLPLHETTPGMKEELAITIFSGVGVNYLALGFQ